jgi:hypothetical protein
LLHVLLGRIKPENKFLILSLPINNNHKLFVT